MVADCKQTLFLRGLDDKVRKTEMRRSLYLLFSQFGTVLDVVIRKVGNARGLGWVVFADTISAGSALRALDERTEVYGRLLKIQYAKETSFVVDASARVRRNERVEAAKKAALLSTANRKRGRE